MLGKGTGLHWSQLREVLTGRTAVLLLGGLAIGALAGKARIASVDAMYFQLFPRHADAVHAGHGHGRRHPAARPAHRGRPPGALCDRASAAPRHAGGAAGQRHRPGGRRRHGVRHHGRQRVLHRGAGLDPGLAARSQRRPLPAAALGIAFPFNLAVGIPLYALVAQSVAR
jgi:hypothetical protein